MIACTIPSAPKARGSAVRAYLQSVRDLLHGQHRAGARASVLASNMAHHVDVVLQELFQCANAGVGGPRQALVALGSLGRCELCPYSDWDVVVVSDDPAHHTSRALADEVFYPLWDAHVDVGHAIRTPRDFANLAIHDDTVRTAAVDWRPIAGDKDLLETLARELKTALAAGDSRRYAARSVRQWLGEANPATVYRLQPNLKSGPGGLRELHRVWWVSRLVWKIDDWRELLSRGFVDRHSFDQLGEGREVILGMRQALHFAAKRRQDALCFDFQDTVAASLNIAAREGHRLASESLLETFYLHAKGIRSASRRVLERLAETLMRPVRRPQVRRIEGFDLLGERITVRSPDQFERHPFDLLRIFRVAQRWHARLYVHAQAHIAAAAATGLADRLFDSPAASRLFVDIVTDPISGGSMLSIMHELGLLQRLLPEFDSITGLVQRDLYHTYTVDAHLIYGATTALRVLSGSALETPEFVRQAAQRITRPHILVFGVLLHDVGKGRGHDHSARGATMAEEAMLRLRLGDEDVADVVFLVREHLQMFKISQRRDLEDAALLARFAALVDSSERLDMLLVLSYVDAITTGAAAWNDWKSALLQELYKRTRDVLRGHDPGENLDERAQRRLADLTAHAGASAAQHQVFAHRLTRRHLLMHRTSLILRHCEAVACAEREGGAACSIAADERRGGWEIVVVGPDRAGLLADLTGVLAAWGVAIDAAHISRTTDGLAIDTFIVRPASCPIFSDPQQCEALRTELSAAALGQQDFGGRLSERRRAGRGLRRRSPPSEVRIVYDLDARHDCTVLDLFAPDYPGLLHQVAKTFFSAGILVILARVATEADRATDAFYLVGQKSGQSLSFEERQRVEVALRAAINDSVC